jgi:hypothetical protein
MMEAAQKIMTTFHDLNYDLRVLAEILANLSRRPRSYGCRIGSLEMGCNLQHRRQRERVGEGQVGQRLEGIAAVAVEDGRGLAEVVVVGDVVAVVRTVPT